MDQTTYDAMVSEMLDDTAWRRLADVVAILIIGLLMGATITYAVVLYRNREQVLMPETNSSQMITPSGVKIKIEEA